MTNDVDSIFNDVFDNEDLVANIIRFGSLSVMLPIMGRLNTTTVRVWIKIEEDLHYRLARRRQHFQVLLRLSWWLGTIIAPYDSTLTTLSLASSLGHLINALGPLMLAIWPQRGASSMIDPRGKTLLAWLWRRCLCFVGKCLCLMSPLFRQMSLQMS